MICNNRYGIKVGGRSQLESKLLQGACCRMGKHAGSGGNVFEAFGTMVNGIHGSHIGQQCLGCANIGSGFFSFDVLFAGLEGHAQGPVSVSIYAYADDSARNAALELVFCGKESGMWATVSQGHAKALG